MELYSEADKTIWEEKYMPVSLKKGQKVSLTKGNPGLKNVVVGIGWDINAYDTGGDFDLDAAEGFLIRTILYSMEILYIRPEQSSIWETTLQVPETEMMSRLRSICQRFLPISQRLHLQLPSMMQRQDARISDRFLMPL